MLCCTFVIYVFPYVPLANKKSVVFLVVFFGLVPKGKPDLWRIITKVDGVNERQVRFITKVNCHITFSLTQINVHLNFPIYVYALTTPILSSLDAHLLTNCVQGGFMKCA